MDIKLKNNKIEKYILFFIIVVSLALVLLQFEVDNSWMYKKHNKEFYKSDSFNEYISEKVNAIYELADRKDFTNNYKSSIQALDNEKNIKYIVVNNYTKEVKSNTNYESINEFKRNEKGYVEIEGKDFNFDMKINNKDFNYWESVNIREWSSFKNIFSNYEEVATAELREEKKTIKNSNTGVSMYAILPEVPKEDDVVNKLYLENKSVYTMQNSVRVISIIALIILIVSIIITKKRGYEFVNSDNKIYKIYSKMRLELKLICIIIPIILDYVLIVGFKVESNSFNNIFRMVATLNSVEVIVSILIKIIYITMIYMLIKDMKYGNLFKNSIIHKYFKVLRKNMESVRIASRKIGLIKRIIIVSFISIILLNIAVFLLSMLIGIYSYMMIAITLIVSSVSFVIFTSYIVSKLGYLNEIMEGVNKIENGDINYKIEVKGNDSFTSLVESINNIGNGLDTAIEERLKSEMMKSELITNVSHDLKTPLTSILNYVDLLKKEDVKPEYLNDYIAILDQKSKRLKILIEDLFEAAKATSGTVELNIEKIQLNQLLTQSIAEMEGKIIEANLDMKVNFPENKVYINADGKKLFRVFENLISNIVKYSLSNTRVYIDFQVKEDYAYITFKNISAYELNFNAGEIIERFKRGDASRTEEGSGLGLSIAKGLVELQGGEFTVQTDGDLFKAIVKLQLSREESTVV